MGHYCPFPASDVARALIGHHMQRKSFVPRMDHPVGVIPAWAAANAAAVCSRAAGAGRGDRVADFLGAFGQEQERPGEEKHRTDQGAEV